MDPLLLVVAFALGFLAVRIGLPPLVGYLAAGFAAAAFGAQESAALDTIADLGVTMLLFTIGLKLKIKNLLRPHIRNVTMIHMGLVVALFCALFLVLGASGFSMFAGMSLSSCLLLAFALSFSSTVFAVKVFEESGRMESLQAEASIGILVMQDVIAVFFLTFSSGKLPSLWAPVMLAALFPARLLLKRIMDRLGHGELLPLFGLFTALALGAAGFDAVGLKPDLGALIMGVLVADHPKADELSKSLMNFKDLFLVGFFLNIGLAEQPTLTSLGLALLLVAAIPFKTALFQILFSRFDLRARTALPASLSLSNYSEFGLIVGAVGVSMGVLSPSWLVVIALALSCSFAIASPLFRASNSIFERLSSLLHKWETEAHLPEEAPISVPSDREITAAVIGMGRIGAGAYDALKERFGDTIVGLDFCPDTVQRRMEEGRHVLQGDATDSEFWARLPENRNQAQLIMLTLPNLKADLDVVDRLKEWGYRNTIAAVVRYDDDAEILHKAGVHSTFNVFTEAGHGFAGHVCSQLAENGKMPLCSNRNESDSDI